MQTGAPWLEIELAREGAEVRASARAGGVAGPPATHVLGPDLGAEALLSFARGVRAAADKGAPLDAPLLARAETIHRALFQGGLDALRRALQPSSGARRRAEGEEESGRRRGLRERRRSRRTSSGSPSVIRR